MVSAWKRNTLHRTWGSNQAVHNLLSRKLSKTQHYVQTSKSSPVPTRAGQAKSTTATHSSDHTRNPSFHIAAARSSSLLGQQLPCCKWRCHTVSGASTFGGRLTQQSTVKINRPQGRYSADLRKHQLGSPAIQRRNKAGREKFSAVSNCSLHKTHFAKSITSI